MKQVLVISLALFISVSAFSQAKQPKEFVIKVDSADAASFLTLINVGLQNLMNTDIPAKQVQGISVYGNGLFQKYLAQYQTWFPKAEAPKKDSVSKKP